MDRTPRLQMQRTALHRPGVHRDGSTDLPHRKRWRLSGRDQGAAGALPTSRPLAGTKWLGHAGGMTSEPTTYPGYRFPAEVISHAVWLYHVFSLSLRDVELLLAERGITVTHETIWQWCLKF